VRSRRDPGPGQGRGPDELTHAGGVEIQTGNGSRTFPQARREDVPRIVAGLVAEGIDIYEVTIIRSTLEDAYLEVVDPG
jgi:ABC-2 type transport system ATP-binding protein